MWLQSQKTFMKLISLELWRLATNGFDEISRKVNDILFVERENVFLLLSMRNRDVDLALSKSFSMKFLYFYHNFWFTHPFSFKLWIILLQLTIDHFWSPKLWKRTVLFLELIINLAHQNRLYGSFTVLREGLFVRI